MLMRRAPMSRGGVALVAGAEKQDQDREARLAERAQRQLESARATAGMVSSNVVMSSGPGSSGIAIEKENAVECEPYRRLVAQLPCMWCGISGYSQHAHLNLGKGLNFKTDDRTGFPLCCTRPGIEGCHVAYDQYRLLEVGGREAHREYGLAWGQITRDTISANGQWPVYLPPWQEPTNKSK